MPRPGWLRRQAENAEREIAEWPKWMRDDHEKRVARDEAKRACVDLISRIDDFAEQGEFWRIDDILGELVAKADDSPDRVILAALMATCHDGVRLPSRATLFEVAKRRIDAAVLAGLEG